MEDTEFSNTPQQVEAPIDSPIYKKASFIDRFYACLIDSLILIILFLLIHIFIETLRPVLGILTSLTSVIFGTFFTWKKGATPGKMLLKLKVVTTAYQPVGFTRAFLRESLGKWISGLLFDLGYSWILIDKRKQAWHDKMENTLVVKLDNNNNLISITDEEKISTKQKVAFILLGTSLFIPLIFLLSYIFFFKPFQMVGNSMIPTYKHREYLMTKIISNQYDDLKRGDVIILHSPTNPDADYIKRIIGMPGDTIALNDGKVTLNGRLLDESAYIGRGVKTESGSFLRDGSNVTVPTGQYFVLGDNRPFSSDSREWGFLKKESVVSEVIFCYWNCSNQ